MTRFVLLLAEDPAVWANATEAEQEAVLQAHADFDAAVRERAAMVGGEALADASQARTLRPGEGGRVMTEGPYTEAAEHLGAFYVVEADDLDTVVDLVGILPATYVVEIRPVVDYGGDDGDEASG